MPELKRFHWMRGFLGVLLGGGLGLLVAIWLRHHLPLARIEVLSIHAAEAGWKVDADLDPSKIPGSSYVRRKTVYTSSPPVLQLVYRIPEGEELLLSNRVATAFQRPVNLLQQPRDEGRRWGLAADAWMWILMGAGVFGCLGLLLPSEADSAASEAVGEARRQWVQGVAGALVVALVVGFIVAFAVGVGLGGFRIWWFKGWSVKPLARAETGLGWNIEPAGAGKLVITHQTGQPWQVWRGGADTSAPPQLVSRMPIRGSNFVDEAVPPGISRYWVASGNDAAQAPRGPGTEAYVLPEATEVRAGREGDGGVRVEWGAPGVALPPDTRMLVGTATGSGASLDQVQPGVSTAAASFGSGSARYAGEVRVTVAMGSERWGTSAPVVRVVAPRVESMIAPAEGGKLRLTLPRFAGGYDIFRATGTNGESRVRLSGQSVTGGVFVDEAPLAGRSWYWVVPAGTERTAPTVEPLEAWVLEPVLGLVGRRDEDGAVRLDWRAPEAPVPADLRVELAVRDGGNPFVPLEGIRRGATSHLYDGGRTNGALALEFRLRRVSERWGAVGTTTAVAAVMSPQVGQRVAERDGRFDLAGARVEGAVRLQLVQAGDPTAAGTPSEAELDALAQPVGASLPVGASVVSLPAAGLRSTVWYSVMAFNAGGRTRVTEWSRRGGPTKAMPFTNSLGQPYVPVSNVFFCVWETRVKDFRAFALATGFKTETDLWSWNPKARAKGSVQWLQSGFSWENPGFPQTDEHPVVGANWDDARRFCEWLTEVEQQAGRIGPNDRYRLPRDAEWSAAVGSSRFPWGDVWPPPNRVGNYADKGFDEGWSRIGGYDDGHPRTSPVGSYRANALGLYDCGGNVREIVQDWYRVDMNTAAVNEIVLGTANAPGAMTGKVLRGGSWFNFQPLSLESRTRDVGSPEARHAHTGFRCVLEPGGLR